MIHLARACTETSATPSPRVYAILYFPSCTTLTHVSKYSASTISCQYVNKSLRNRSVQLPRRNLNEHVRCKASRRLLLASPTYTQMSDLSKTFTDQRSRRTIELRYNVLFGRGSCYRMKTSRYIMLILCILKHQLCLSSQFPEAQVRSTYGNSGKRSH